MSKYDPLWERVRAQPGQEFTMTFDQVRGVFGFDIDHSFLSFKKELLAHGWPVAKISLKNKAVAFVRTAG